MPGIYLFRLNIQIMMRQLIGAAVAGLLLMVWQTLSHTALNLHAAQEQYTPAQDTILQVLSSHLTASGQYFMPGLPPGASMEDYEALTAKSMGKPYASVLYHPQMEYSMTANLLRGLATNLLLAALLVWLLQRLRVRSFLGILGACLAIGFMAFCFYPYPGFIWYQTPGIWTELLDGLAAFGLAGLWLGWWMPRQAKK